MTHKLEILRIGGRYTQSQVLNWQQEPEYLVCNDLETGQLFLAKRGLGTWCEVDLHMLARKLNTQQGAAQREGWKLVPREPTQEMRSIAADAAFYSQKRATYVEVYQAMYDAAPEPPNERMR